MRSRCAAGRARKREPDRGNPSKVMQAIKQGFARRLLRKQRALCDPRHGSLWEAALDGRHVWPARFYDFVVFSESKRVEKLRYMHLNPVKRGLVLESQQWDWSSYRHYAEGEPGIVVVMKNGDEGWEDRVTPSKSRSVVPSFAKSAKLGQPQLVWCGQGWASPPKKAKLGQPQAGLEYRFAPSPSTIG